MWGMLERLGVVDIVDEVVGSRRSDAALSVGTYIALAALNRVVAPCSKLAFSDWWATTAGDRLLERAPVAALDHRRFWDAMDAITDEHLIEIERRIVARMVEEFAVDVSGLVLDMTNFATYIDSANDRAPIAQRGKAKQKRTTCDWSVSGSWSRSTAASRWSATPMRATATTPPSSPT